MEEGGRGGERVGEDLQRFRDGFLGLSEGLCGREFKGGRAGIGDWEKRIGGSKGGTGSKGD